MATGGPSSASEAFFLSQRSLLGERSRCRASARLRLRLSLGELFELLPEVFERLVVVLLELLVALLDVLERSVGLLHLGVDLAQRSLGSRGALFGSGFARRRGVGVCGDGALRFDGL